jgi:hypothetical protein
MADKIVAEYIVKTDKAVAELNKIVGRLDAIDKERKQTQDGFKSMSKGMAADFKKVGAAIGLAFGAQELVSFGKEAVKLSSQMEGVERAFKRIGGANSANLLEGLRKATRGTVSDLQLMQKAVQASNFKIPLENLASLFKFAQARARETGESVEYLTNSIVLGIGRKSPLILDNLGISAVELRDRLKGVGVEASSVGDIAKIIGEIAEEELAKMGDQADTTADKLEKINAALDNMKVVAGEALINFGTGLLYLAGQIDTGIDATDGITKAAENLADIYENDVVGAVDKMLEKNKELLANQLKIAELEETRGYQNSTEAINNINEQIEKIEERNVFLREYIKQLKAIYEESQKEDAISKTYINTINQLNTELKDLKKRFNDAEIGGSEWNQLVIDISKKTSELEAATTKATAKLIMFQQAARGFDPFAVQQEEPDLDFKAIDEETEAIREAINEQVFIREDGSERIQNIIDEQLRATLEGLDDEEKARKKIDEQKEKYHQLELRRKEEERRFGLQIVQETANLVALIGELQQKSVQHDLNALDKLYSQGKINREQYEKEERDIKIKAAKQAKALAIFQAVVNTAVGITQALSSAPPPYSYVLAGISGALGAVQIGVAAAEPLPQFADGGFVNEHGQLIGRKHSQGGITIEAEGGEFITSAKHAQQNADILKAINSGDWEKYKMENIIAPAINQVLEGGFQGMGASYMLNTNWTDKNLLKQGDRNRYAMRDGFIYLGDRMEKTLRRQKFDRYA